MRSRTRDALPTQRYDVRDERGSGMFVTRYWNTVNSAVTDDDGRVIGVLHRVYEVQRPLAQQSSSASDVLTRLRAENDELRRALDSRPLIEQAKGLLMAERECSADQAFDFLVRCRRNGTSRCATSPVVLSPQQNDVPWIKRIPDDRDSKVVRLG